MLFSNTCMSLPYGRSDVLLQLGIAVSSECPWTTLGHIKICFMVSWYVLFLTVKVMWLVKIRKYRVDNNNWCMIPNWI